MTSEPKAAELLAAVRAVESGERSAASFFAGTEASRRAAEPGRRAGTPPVTPPGPARPDGPADAVPPAAPDPAVAEAVRTGRRREFAAHGWNAEDIPDPQDPSTRDRSCLDWDEPAAEPHARVLAWYRRLVALRRETADLTDPDLAGVRVAYDEARRWLVFRRGDLRVAVNLGKDPVEIPLQGDSTRVLASWDEVEAPGADGVLTLPPESCALLTPVR